MRHGRLASNEGPSKILVFLHAEIAIFILKMQQALENLEDAYEAFPKLSNLSRSSNIFGLLVPEV